MEKSNLLVINTLKTNQGFVPCDPIQTSLKAEFEAGCIQIGFFRVIQKSEEIGKVRWLGNENLKKGE